MLRQSDLTEQQITTFVHAFYARVQTDAVLSPIFEARMSGTWEDHLPRMISFWSNILLGKPGFVGDPIGKHRAMDEITPAHFDHWLELFEKVLREVLPEQQAIDVVYRARQMRVSLQRPGV